MQQATHPRLHVRDARDAHAVFEAVRQGLLRPAVRRLNEVERSMHVRSGSVFVWEECDDESGLKRWTGIVLPPRILNKDNLTSQLRWTRLGSVENAGGNHL